MTLRVVFTLCIYIWSMPIYMQVIIELHIDFFDGLVHNYSWSHLWSKWKYYENFVNQYVNLMKINFFFFFMKIYNFGKIKILRRAIYQSRQVFFTDTRKAKLPRATNAFFCFQNCWLWSCALWLIIKKNKIQGAVKGHCTENLSFLSKWRPWRSASISRWLAA